MIKNVTDQVKIGDIDGESLVLLQCVCGELYEPWDNILHPYQDLACPCSKCGRKLVFQVKIDVFEVVE